MCTTHNKCHTSSVERIQEFPEKDEHLKYLQDRLGKDELSIQQIEGITEKVVKDWIVKASVSNCLPEYLYQVTPPKMAEINSPLVVHKVTVRLLKPLLGPEMALFDHPYSLLFALSYPIEHAK